MKGKAGIGKTEYDDQVIQDQSHRSNVRIRETITIGDGMSTLTDRLNSQVPRSLDLQSSFFHRDKKGKWGGDMKGEVHHN